MALSDSEKGIKMEEKIIGCPECCGRKKERGEEEKRLLTNRLKRIEGQVRGVSRMIDEGAYCANVLTQVSAISSALSAFTRELLATHIRTCVSEDIKNEREGACEELIELLSRLIK